MMSEGGRIWNIPICPNHGIFLPGGLPGNGEQERSAGTHLAPLLRMSITLGPPSVPVSLWAYPRLVRRGSYYTAAIPVPRRAWGIDIRSKVQ
jgi:hypothetical protein